MAQGVAIKWRAEEFPFDRVEERVFGVNMFSHHRWLGSVILPRSCHDYRSLSCLLVLINFKRALVYIVKNLPRRIRDLNS